jgi:hypothetical protein
MPGTHPRNAKLTGFMHTADSEVAARWGWDMTRLRVRRIECGREDFDAISLLADDEPGREAVQAIQARERTTRARTLARRRDTVERAQEAADAMGWTLTEDERAALEAF